MALQSSYDVYQQVTQFIERNLDPIRRASIHGVDMFDLGELWSPSRIQVYDMLIAGSTVNNNEYDARFDYHARKSREARTLAKRIAEIVEPVKISLYGRQERTPQEREAAAEMERDIMHAARAS